MVSQKIYLNDVKAMSTEVMKIRIPVVFFILHEAPGIWLPDICRFDLIAL